MQTWRETGFVADSDDDDEISLDGGPARKDQQKPGTSQRYDGQEVQKRLVPATATRIPHNKDTETAATEEDSTSVSQPASAETAGHNDSSRRGREGVQAETDELSPVKKRSGVGRSLFKRSMTSRDIQQAEPQVDVVTPLSRLGRSAGTSQREEGEPPWIFKGVCRGGATFGRAAANTVSTTNRITAQGADDAGILLETADAGARHNSAASSPLSQPSSDVLRASPPPLHLDEDIFPSASAVLLPHQETTEMDMLNAVFDSAPVRNFRARKAIQLHPYMLESEKHRQMFRAAGFKPIHVAQSPELGATQPVRRHVPPNADESSDLPSSQTSFNLSQPSTQYMSMPEARQPLFSAHEDDEDTLHPVSSQHRRTPGRLPKRRKLFHAPTDTPSAHGTPTKSGHDLESSRARLPTPPTSHSELSANADEEPKRRTKFRLPKAVRPRSLNNVSLSEPTTPIGYADLAALPLANTSPRVDAPVSVSSSDSESSGTQSLDSEKHFEVARKRIRGVLPASWLRIDGTAAKKAADVRKGLQNRTESGIGDVIKGLAQRKSVPQPSPSKPSMRFEDFSEDSDDQQERVANRAALDAMGGATLDLQSDLVVDSDEMEDDTVDAMLPVASRARRTKSNGPSKHNNLWKHPSSKIRRERPAASDHSGENAAVSRSRPEETSRRIDGTSRQSRLSILDLTSPSDKGSSTLPQFLKVAQRQSRKRGRVAQQSPTHKTIRLATQLDTLDAKSTLTAWKSGKIARTAARKVRQQSAPHSKSSREGNLRPIERSRTVLVQPRITKVLDTQRPTTSTGGQVQSENAPVSSKPQLRRSRIIQHSARPRETYHPIQLQDDDHRPRVEQAVNPVAAARLALERLAPAARVAENHQSLQLERFLQELPAAEAEAEISEVPVAPERQSAPSFVVTRRPGKRLPRRLSIEHPQYHQPLAAPVVTLAQDDLPEVPDVYCGLIGLEERAQSLSIDFDVQHLDPATFFRSSTFLGSGDFADVLSLPKRDLGRPAGRISIRISDVDTIWSAWTGETASWLSEILKTIKDAITYMRETSTDPASDISAPAEAITYLLRSLTRYISGCLHFQEPSDLIPFADQMQDFVQDIFDCVTIGSQQLVENGTLTLRTHMADCCIYLACMCYQLSVIRSQAVQPGLQTSHLSTMSALAMLTLVLLFRQHCSMLVDIYEETRHSYVRDRGVEDDQVSISCLVILSHLESAIERRPWNLDSLIDKLWSEKIAATRYVGALESVWRDVIVLQPAFELDVHGLIRRPSCPSRSSQWTIVKNLVARTFDLCSASSAVVSTEIAKYLGVVLARITLLQQEWGWTQSDPVLAVIYDFFARRQLTHLETDRITESATFLTRLDQESPLRIDTHDLVFNTFLKLLAINFHKSIFDGVTPNKLRSAAWRFMPNHGRTYRKDEPVRQLDLQALQNHHDLLCTLFWALPPGCGIKLQKIEELVDFHASHQEACRINLGAWRNLAVFIVSHQSQHGHISELTSWLRAMISATVHQHRSALSEAEQQYELFKAGQSTTLSYDVLQMTVGSNQRRLLDTLSLALKNLHEVFEICPGNELQIRILLESGALAIFKLFDSTQSRTNAPTVQLLKIVAKVLSPCKRQSSSTVSGAVHDSESQDYGFDDDDFDEYMDDSVGQALARDEPMAPVRSAVAQLLSNCFGADHVVQDAVLTNLVDVWSTLMKESVKCRSRSWSDYLDIHGSDSWFQLRSTDQHSKYTSYVLARVAALDPSSFAQHQELFLSHWLVALVDCESHLKFQHLLTSALLNVETGCHILHNLPFAIDDRTEQYDITLVELRARRISLIGSIFANMSAHIDSLGSASSSASAHYRREYGVILKQVMAAMRSCFQAMNVAEPAISSGHTQPSSNDTHIIFIQRVISLMQQYTTDICPIDVFFTEPGAFPLPSNDPKYHISKLRSYASRVDSDRGRKQLTILLQTLVANAVNCESTLELADQITEALLPDGAKSENTAQDTAKLGHLVMTDVMAGYLDAASETQEAIAYALPLIEVAGRFIAQLKYHTRPTVSPTADEVDMINVAVLGLVSLALTIQSSSSDQEAICLSGHIFNALAKMLSYLDWVHRSTGRLEACLAHIRRLRQLANVWCTTSSASIGSVPIDLAGFGAYPPVPAHNPSALTSYVSRNLRELATRHYHGQGQHERRIGLLASSREEEVQRMKSAAEDFVRHYDYIFGASRSQGIHESHVAQHSEGVMGGSCSVSELMF